MKYALASLLLILGTCSQLARAASPPPSSWTARIVDSDALLRSYGFPSKIVEVTFPKSFPTNVVKSVRNYQLSKSDDPSANFEIQGVRLGPNLHGDEEEGAESPSKVSRGFLLPRLQLDPPGQNQAYILKVVFGEDSSGDIPVSWAAGPAPKPPPSDNELLNIISVTSNLLFGPFNFSIDARSPLE